MMRHRREGFTLLELLVSMAALGVVSSIGVQAFFGLTDAWKQARTKADLEAATANAFQTIRRDFASIAPASFSGRPIQGVHADVEDTRFFQIVLADDRLVLPVFAADTAGRVQLRRVEYFVRREPAGGTLMRGESAMGEEASRQDVTPVLDLGDVLRIRFEFFDADSGMWSESWGRPDLPAAVRASMTVGYRPDIPEPGPPEPQIARKAVFAVKVR